MASRDLEKEIDNLADTLSSIRSTLGDLANRAGSDAGSLLSRGQSSVRRGARQVYDQARYGESVVEDTIRDHPLASVGIAFAIGAALAGAIRR